MKGILSDNDVRGQVDYLAALMQADPWTEFWQGLGLALLHFEDVGLLPTTRDLEVWERCQKEDLVLITSPAESAPFADTDTGPAESPCTGARPEGDPGRPGSSAGRRRCAVPRTAQNALHAGRRRRGTRRARLRRS